MKKGNGLFLWVGRVVVSILVIFLLISAAAYFFKVPEPPSAKDAQWGIQTYSNDQFRVPARIYYTNEIAVVDGTPIAKNSWWSYDGKRYHKHQGDKPFPENEYGKIDIIRRK
jgi:hypothetical protein